MVYRVGGLRRFGATLPAGSRYDLEVRTHGVALVASADGAMYPAEFRLPIQTGVRSMLAGRFRVQK